MATSWVRPALATLALITLTSLCWMQAQETTTKKASILETTALRLAPANCSYFTTSLKLKDRILSLWNTKAVQQAWKTPLIQTGWMEIQKNWAEQSGPLQGFLQQKENQELVQLLLDMTSEECFFMGGPTLASFTDLASGIFSNLYYGSFVSAFDPTHDPVTGRIRAVLEALQEDLDKLVAPDVLVGFKVNDPKVAQRQLARLAVLLNTAALAVPQLTGNVKNQKVGNSNFTTITVDGAKLPWNLIPWSDVEDEPGEFDDLKDHLKKIKFTVCIGYHEGYIMCGLGQSLDFLKNLGKGKKLTELPEFQPLQQHLDKRIHGISYSSKEMNNGSGFTKEQADTLVEQWTKMLEESDLEDDVREKIQKDFKELAVDLYQIWGHEAGAAMSVSFGTDRGEETFAYQYSIDKRTDFTKPLNILQHAGGSPLLAMAGRSFYKPENWNLLVKWAKRGDFYFREYALPQLEQLFGADMVEKVEKLLSGLYPLFQRLDTTVRTNFLPALADGQFAFVVDNKQVSTQWHQDLPMSKHPLPMLEPALVMSVTDREKLKQGASDVRAVFNEAMKLIQQIQPDEIPEIKWPAPDSRKIEDTDLYWYSFPDEAKIDGRLKPSAGLSKSVCALTISNEHALRLMQATPLAIEGGPLADQKRPLGGATVFHLAGLVETAQPWVTYMLEQPEMKSMHLHAKDVQTLVNSLKYFHSYSSATYLENKVTVTHSEWRVKDMP